MFPTLQFVRSAALVAAGLLLASTGSAGPLDEMQACAVIDDDTDRLRCYDAIDLPSAPTTPAPAPTTAADVTVESIGAEQLPAARREQEQPEVNVQARVSRCERDASRKKYVFYFEGGQVWKQVSDKRLFFRDCDFNVTVTKDVFGYKMQIDGEKSKIRISRLR